MTTSLKQVLTLNQYLLQSGLGHSIEQQRDLAIIVGQIQLACKMIASAVNRAALESLLGEAGIENCQGEAVKKLDVLANQAFIDALTKSGVVSAIASEEESKPIFIETLPGTTQNYVVYFDPLDGSSNIDANVSIGSIFGIAKQVTPQDQAPNDTDILQPGRNLLASGYALYGAATMLVLTFGRGVNGFTLDGSLGEFVLTHPNISTKPLGKIYSINEGNGHFWEGATKHYVDGVKNNSYSLRYVGSMVADVHRTLLYGGIFMYPGDSRTPTGKLRYLYEVSPLSFVLEQAGGASSDGRTRALDILPTSIHMRVPCFMGSRLNVEALNNSFTHMDEGRLPHHPPSS
mmetsp:Transcript_54053/g.89963  ORF Transcript_54053/g.89963 Transcript_54053/m.89963 type:complete len:346 (+) Transcript_54053:207-1244(+)|eukprot:CAMPEP_0184339176 /NCGR_PEP_ID=MMETSP1089-20130417/7850_1 /TAXON_ID=38269 ORGANISM="Gloeochaete wittrockiana, Strain SAG46.84" /NCGR_SAMPLE_ID=MMETSP1089 /ASSEMBLY_ACC=CAM_ASM_000445 /LENGTH=345 /DNA_ID=CAMNT_0026666279 /DNA_START=153 /DNA_END=1190 /DNA_ORIENTATION=+